MTPNPLEIDRVTMRFGGLKALSSFTLSPPTRTSPSEGA